MKSITLLWFGIAVFSVGQAQAPEIFPDLVPNTQSNDSFKDQEWFEFRIHYGFFNASIATLKLEETIPEQPTSFPRQRLRKNNWFGPLVL